MAGPPAGAVCGPYSRFYNPAYCGPAGYGYDYGYGPVIGFGGFYGGGWAWRLSWRRIPRWWWISRWRWTRRASLTAISSILQSGSGYTGAVFVCTNETVSYFKARPGMRDLPLRNSLVKAALASRQGGQQDQGGQQGQSGKQGQGGKHGQGGPGGKDR
jgi:hypothetical protein